VHQEHLKISSKSFTTLILKSFKRIDIVADTYRDTSIKSSERNKHGESAKKKLPADMAKFMLNNDIKSSLIEIVVDYISSHKESLLRKLNAQIIFFSTYGETRLFTDETNTHVLNFWLFSPNSETNGK